MENTIIEMPEKNSEGINGKMRIQHVGLRTTDYEGTIAWYTEKLRFRLLKKFSNGDLKMAFIAPANDDNFWIEVLNGGVSGTTQDPSQPIISGFQHICIEVEYLDKTMDVLREKDIKIMREPFPVPVIGKRCGFITDLFGNVIEFTENI